jgi:hypothetical protein
MRDNRAQITEQIEFGPDPKKPKFGSLLGGLIIPFRAAHGAQQCGVGTATGIDGCLRQRCTGFIHRGAADQLRVKFNTQAKAVFDRGQHLAGRSEDFRSYPVSRQTNNSETLAGLIFHCVVHKR